MLELTREDVCTVFSANAMRDVLYLLIRTVKQLAFVAVVLLGLRVAPHNPIACQKIALVVGTITQNVVQFAALNSQLAEFAIIDRRLVVTLEDAIALRVAFLTSPVSTSSTSPSKRSSLLILSVTVFLCSLGKASA